MGDGLPGCRAAASPARARLLRLRGGDGRFTRRRELPSGEVVLIIGFGPKLETTYPRLAPDRGSMHRSFVAYSHETHRLVATPGNQVGIQLNLTLLGAHPLLGLPMHELTNRVVELDDLLGADGEPLVEQLHDAPDWGRPAALLDEVLVRRLDAARPASPMSPGLAAAGRHRRSPARGRAVRSSAAAASTCCAGSTSRSASRRRPSPACCASNAPSTCWPPRRRGLARRARAGRRPADELGRDRARVRLLDQAHMNRDFRQFAGASPGGWPRACCPTAAGSPAGAGHIRPRRAPAGFPSLRHTGSTTKRPA